MKRSKRTIAGGAAATVFALAAITGACSSDPSGPAGKSRLQVLVTDAPSDYIAQAVVWVSAVYLQGGEGDGEPRVYLFNDAVAPKEFDLLLLQNGVNAELTAIVDVDARDYHQLRLVVDSARVTLVNGFTFNDLSVTRRLMVPSGAQSGIKVNLAGAIEAEVGELTVIVVDFAVDDSFVIQGNPGTPAGIMGILLTPTLHEKSRQEEAIG
jgi:hypothetical protein